MYIPYLFTPTADPRAFPSPVSRASTLTVRRPQTADKAQHALDKAVENEHKAAKAVNRAVHNHDAAISNEQNAEKTVQVRSQFAPPPARRAITPSRPVPYDAPALLQIKQQHETRLEQDLEQKRRHLNELQQRKAQNDVRTAASHSDPRV